MVNEGDVAGPQPPGQIFRTPVGSEGSLNRSHEVKPGGIMCPPPRRVNGRYLSYVRESDRRRFDIAESAGALIDIPNGLAKYVAFGNHAWCPRRWTLGGTPTSRGIYSGCTSGPARPPGFIPAVP